MLKYKIDYGRAKNDIEKSLLPTILYVPLKRKNIKIKGFAIGWWDYYIALWLANKAT